MNEPYGWTFLCIWYENSWFRVHEVKRLGISFYMAFCVPLHLRQRTSRVYQDHLHFFRVLTSFVPPVHNRGVSLAPLQGLCPMENIPADYWLILCLSVTDSSSRFPHQHLSADVFPVCSSCFQPSCHGWIQSSVTTTENSIQPWQAIPCFFLLCLSYAACNCGLWMSLINFCGS